MKTLLTWLKRLILGLVALVALLVVVCVAIIVFTRDSSAELTNVTYTGADGTELSGYLAQPAGDGPHPTILLIHEWWGLNHGLIVLADALAAEGYTVLAADAYRGDVTSQVPTALYLRLTIPEEQVFHDVDAALDYLYTLDSVDTSRIASMGFCFGGGQSLQLGLRQSERLAATIMYYGTVVTDIEPLKALVNQGPVFGIFGEEDQQILPADVLEFEANLNSLNIENDITIYDDVGHGFLNEDNYDEAGAAGDAWQETLAFLEEEFMDGR